MRFLAILLSSVLVLQAQQAVPAPPQPAQQTAPGAPQPAKPVTIGEGATATMNADIANKTTPWVGTGEYIRKTFKINDTAINIAGPVRLRDFIADGKLTLSLRNYLELVLANNTDIAITRLNLELPQNAIQRAFSVFDPTVISSFGATRATTPATNQLQGAAVVSNLNQPFSVRYQQTLPFSTQVYTTYNWSKLSTNDTFAIYNPAYTDTWQMGFTQPLLRNRGTYITKLPITVARASKAQQDVSFQDTLLRSMVTAENAYWDVINARERIRVQKEAVKLAQASLDRTRLEIKLGATSELEVFQPEQNAATQQIALTQFEYALRQNEDILRRQIGADLDPAIRELPIVLTEDVTRQPDDTQYDREKMVTMALDRRPDLRAQQLTKQVNELNIQSALNLLKPNLNATGYYQTYGRGGPGYVRNVFVPGSPIDAFNMMGRFDYPTYNFGVTLNLPLRDHTASANLADAVVNQRLAALRERTIQQTVRQDVLTAVTNVEASREGVKQALIVRDYSRKRAEADQKRYDLGVINIFYLLASQNDLTTAESNVVTQVVTYRRNVLTLQQRLGTLLDDKGIVVQ
jgi:outer membrane protein TolC